MNNYQEIYSYIKIVFWILFAFATLGSVFLFIVIGLLFRQDDKVEESYPPEVDEKLYLDYDIIQSL